MSLHSTHTVACTQNCWSIIENVLWYKFPYKFPYNLLWPWHLTHCCQTFWGFQFQTFIGPEKNVKQMICFFNNCFCGVRKVNCVLTDQYLTLLKNSLKLLKETFTAKPQNQWHRYVFKDNFISQATLHPVFLFHLFWHLTCVAPSSTTDLSH